MNSDSIDRKLLSREELARTRKENALKIINEEGLTFSDFAKAIKRAPSYASMILGDNATRRIGANTARLIEKSFLKPKGWLDITNHHTRRPLDEIADRESSISDDINIYRFKGKLAEETDFDGNRLSELMLHSPADKEEAEKILNDFIEYAHIQKQLRETPAGLIKDLEELDNFIRKIQSLKQDYKDELLVFAFDEIEHSLFRNGASKYAFLSSHEGRSRIDRISIVEHITKEGQDSIKITPVRVHVSSETLGLNPIRRSGQDLGGRSRDASRARLLMLGFSENENPEIFENLDRVEITSPLNVFLFALEGEIVPIYLTLEEEAEITIQLPKAYRLNRYIEFEEDTPKIKLVEREGQYFINCNDVEIPLDAGATDIAEKEL